MGHDLLPWAVLAEVNAVLDRLAEVPGFTEHYRRTTDHELKSGLILIDFLGTLEHRQRPGRG